MSLKRGLVFLLAAAVFPVAVAGCDSDEPAPIRATEQPTAGPDRQATLSVLAERREVGVPSPTPVDPVERELALSFAKAQADISRDWDKFHADLDIWREGLTDCDASSREVALRGFASQLAVITESARALPRSSAVRELADNLIAAIEQEEASLRELRDGWEPGATDLFENVDAARSAAGALQKEVEDNLSDLQTKTSSASREGVDNFSSAVGRLNTLWDTFHRGYDRFRAEEADLPSLDTVEKLGSLVDEFGSIVGAVRSLPSATEATRGIAGVLAEAAESEDLALRKLRGTFQREEVPVAGVADGEGEATADQVEVIFTPQDPSLFDAFDAALVDTNAKRREALQGLAIIQDAASEESQRAVQKFAGEYASVSQSLSGFHGEYDRWRRTEGGCDVSKAIETLGELTLDFGKLAARVRELPRASILRPLGELLVGAAEREEQALRDLRNGWRPFDADIYGALDQERNSTSRLRRQVASGVQDLLDRYSIAPEDLAS